MTLMTFDNWRLFHIRFLLEYAGQDRSRRAQFLFRGHSDTRWPLKTTLDRHHRFEADTDRNEYYQRLLSEFRREAVRLSSLPEIESTSEAFELLARHHGIPSPMLDWTESPYVAAYFAYNGAKDTRGRKIAIWTLDLSKFDYDTGDVEIIDDPEKIRLNRRALRQRGVFTNVKSIREPLESMLDEALTKIELPTPQKTIALADLDEMAINAATLFDDLDSVAQLVTSRVATFY